jgi:hypothetical protein
VRLELRAKRVGFHVEPTFMADDSISNDIHVDIGISMRSRLGPKNMRTIDIC